MSCTKLHQPASLFHANGCHNSQSNLLHYRTYEESCTSAALLERWKKEPLKMIVSARCKGYVVLAKALTQCPERPKEKKKGLQCCAMHIFPCLHQTIPQSYTSASPPRVCGAGEYNENNKNTMDVNFHKLP